jgi:hypothetical protein
MADSFDQLVLAVKTGKVDDVRQALDRHPEVRKRLDEPHPDLPFDSTILLSAVHQKNKLIDVLLNAGADVNVRSRWRAGGFGALHSADTGLVPFLLDRGAVVEAHAAARLGMIDRDSQIPPVDRDPRSRAQRNAARVGAARLAEQLALPDRRLRRSTGRPACGRSTRS